MTAAERLRAARSPAFARLRRRSQLPLAFGLYGNAQQFAGDLQRLFSGDVTLGHGPSGTKLRLSNVKEMFLNLKDDGLDDRQNV